MHTRSALSIAPLLLSVGGFWIACAGSAPSVPSVAPQRSVAQSTSAPSGSFDDAAIAAESDDARLDAVTEGNEDAAPDTSASAPPVSSSSASQGPCPADMMHVVHDFCPTVDRDCIKKEKNKPNHIMLCHKYRSGSTRCLAPRHHLDFCIDVYEYPNREGAHPPWMVSWYDAEATCRALGKRTCWDEEWVTACEGPDEAPFPYGWERDNTKCNIDNMWLEPRLKEMYSKDKDIALKELSRLDQSVPSGSMPACVSGYGVHDLTGNMDEWVTRADRKDKEKSEWAGLKGGGWGHVRNACRPMTTSHPPDFTYYFVTFRCCKDPLGRPPFVAPGSSAPPVQAPADRAPVPRPIHPPGPSKQKVKPENNGT